MPDLVKQPCESLVKKLPQCEFVMTHAEGEHIAKTKGLLRGRSYKITYDLMMCKYCGNLQGAEANKDFCPVLMKTLKLSR